MEGAQFFCPTKGKGTYDGPGYCRQRYFSVEVVTVLILIHPCHDISGIIFYTKQEEDNYNFIFLLGDGISY